MTEHSSDLLPEKGCSSESPNLSTTNGALFILSISEPRGSSLETSGIQDGRQNSELKAGRISAHRQSPKRRRSSSVRRKRDVRSRCGRRRPFSICKAVRCTGSQHKAFGLTKARVYGRKRYLPFSGSRKACELLRQRLPKPHISSASAIQRSVLRASAGRH